MNRRSFLSGLMAAPGATIITTARASRPVLTTCVCGRMVDRAVSHEHEICRMAIGLGGRIPDYLPTAAVEFLKHAEVRHGSRGGDCGYAVTHVRTDPYSGRGHRWRLLVKCDLAGQVGTICTGHITADALRTWVGQTYGLILDDNRVEPALVVLAGTTDG